MALPHIFNESLLYDPKDSLLLKSTVSQWGLIWSIFWWPVQYFSDMRSFAGHRNCDHFCLNLLNTCISDHFTLPFLSSRLFSLYCCACTSWPFFGQVGDISVLPPPQNVKVGRKGGGIVVCCLIRSRIDISPHEILHFLHYRLHEM